MRRFVGPAQAALRAGAEPPPSKEDISLSVAEELRKDASSIPHDQGWQLFGDKPKEKPRGMKEYLWRAARGWN